SHHDAVGDRRLLMIGIVTDVEKAAAWTRHFKPGMVMDLFAFEAVVQIGLDGVSEGVLAPDVFHGGAEYLLPALAVSPTIGVVGGFIAVIGGDERQEFARGVDDGFVALPHLLGGFAPRDFVT